MITSVYVCVWVVKNWLFYWCGFDSRYCIGKNIYTFYCSLITFCFHRSYKTIGFVYFFCLSVLFLAVVVVVVAVVVVVVACMCLSECVCVFAALLLVVRFVLFLY